MLIKNKLDTSDLVTKIVLNTKTSENENKIPNATDLVKKTVYDAKILEIEGKYFTTSDLNKFTSETLDAKIKQKELVNKSDIFNIAKKNLT